MSGKTYAMDVHLELSGIVKDRVVYNNYGFL